MDQLVFKHMVDAQFPKLTAHLDSLGVNVASVSTQWFLCMFVNSLPLETCLRVWDIFFFDECSSVLFRVALALVDIYSQVMSQGCRAVVSCLPAYVSGLSFCSCAPFLLTDETLVNRR